MRAHTVNMRPVDRRCLWGCTLSEGHLHIAAPFGEFCSSCVHNKASNSRVNRAPTGWRRIQQLLPFIASLVCPPQQKSPRSDTSVLWSLASFFVVIVKMGTVCLCQTFVRSIRCIKVTTTHILCDPRHFLACTSRSPRRFSG